MCHGITHICLLYCCIVRTLVHRINCMMCNLGTLLANINGNNYNHYNSVYSCNCLIIATRCLHVLPNIATQLSCVSSCVGSVIWCVHIYCVQLRTIRFHITQIYVWYCSCNVCYNASIKFIVQSQCANSNDSYMC